MKLITVAIPKEATLPFISSEKKQAFPTEKFSKRLKKVSKTMLSQQTSNNTAALTSSVIPDREDNQIVHFS